MSDHSSLRIRDLPEEDRPRERLERQGPGALSDAELLAVFLRTGIAGKSAIEVGRDLLSSFGSLNGLAQQDIASMKKVKGLGLSKASQLVAALELARRLATQKAEGTVFDTPETVVDLLGPQIRHLPKESLRVILLNSRLRLVKTEEISLGSHNETVAHPSHVLRPAVQLSAHALIVAHNHPSGDPTPSEADRVFTRRLRDACDVMRVVLADHVIIGRPSVAFGQGYFSFREHGLL